MSIGNLWAAWKAWQRIESIDKKGQWPMILSNWKTTILGLVIAVCYAVQNYTGTNGWKGYVMAGAIAAFGFIAKDWNVTGGTKTLGLVLCLLLLVPSARAQLPANIYAAGASYNVGGSPAVAGTGLYAHQATDGTGTYAFTVVDALPITYKPFTVNTNWSFGVAQKVLTIGKVPIYIPAASGVTFSGTNTGWNWSIGTMAAIRVKQSNWYVLPAVRVVKSSVSGGTGYQPVVGVLFGWGQ